MSSILSISNTPISSGNSIVAETSVAFAVPISWMMATTTATNTASVMTAKLAIIGSASSVVPSATRITVNVQTQTVIRWIYKED